MPPPSSQGPCLVVTDATRPPVPASGAAALPLLLGSTGPPCSRAARAWRADGEGPRTGCPPVCPLLPCMLHCPVSSRATHELKDSSGRLQRCRCDGRAGNQARRPGGGRGARWATPPRSSFCFVSALVRSAVALAVRSQPCPGVDRFVWAVEWVFVVLLSKSTPVALVNVVPWWCFGDPPLLHALATTDLLPGSWGGSREHG